MSLPFLLSSIYLYLSIYISVYLFIFIYLSIYLLPHRPHHLTSPPLPLLQTVSAGSRVSVRCRVQGSPVAEVRWYKDGSPLHTHTHAHLMLQGRDTLVITGVGERDAGMYQCVAANSLGEAQASSQISIRGERNRLKSAQIGSSGSDFLKCEIG